MPGIKEVPGLSAVQWRCCALQLLHMQHVSLGAVASKATVRCSCAVQLLH
jgi:hypothetical protein